MLYVSSTNSEDMVTLFQTTLDYKSLNKLVQSYMSYNRRSITIQKKNLMIENWFIKNFAQKSSKIL